MNNCYKCDSEEPSRGDAFAKTMVALSFSSLVLVGAYGCYKYAKQQINIRALQKSGVYSKDLCLVFPVDVGASNPVEGICNEIRDLLGGNVSGIIAYIPKKTTKTK